MAHRQKEIKDLMQSVLEDDFGLTVLEFGVKKGSNHQYARVIVDGIQRDITFSLSPRKTVRRGSLRADTRKRLMKWKQAVQRTKNGS